MKLRGWIIAALLFGSGCCALVEQVAWFRAFRLIFGTSTAASAAVLAIFVGGLGLGGLLIGPRADRHRRPLLLYAQLEAIVAISVAATPFLLAIVRSLYLATGGTATLGGATATLGRLALSAIVLAIPTIAMGGTLPAATRAVTRDSDVRRQDVAALYALNTLGAVVGSGVATFWLLETFGTQATIWVAACVNLLIALFAWLIERWSPVDVAVAAENQPRAKRSAASKREPVPARAESAAPGGYRAPASFVLIAACGVGFAFFLLELVWYRLLAPLLSGSVFTFGLVLAVALAGIGLGGLLYTLFADDKPATLTEFGSTCLLEAAAVAGTFALGDRVAILTLALLPLRVAGFGTQIACWTLVTALVVLPPAIIAGYQFPLLIALFGRGRDHVGTQVGRAYAANTAGAILGSLAGGFGLLPWLSATGAWQLVAISLLVLGAAAVVIDRVNGASVRRIALPWQIAVAGAAIFLVGATGPTAVWRDTGIGAFRADPKDVLTSVNQFRDWNNLQRRTLVWEGDGTESGVALTRASLGYSLFINGKSDGSARGDAGNLVMLGLLGALATPNARQALIIGLGTGSSAGWLANVPSMQRVDIVELEPLVVDVARACGPVNQNVLQNPKVTLTIGDAREMLQTTRERYDIIASQPSNPFRAGIASLFTLEYYRSAADRLTDDGVFVQWVQGYEIDTPTLRTIYKTLGTVFPQIETWQTDRYDLVLVASKHPHRYRAVDLARRIAEEPFKSALADTWRAVDMQGLLAHYIANDSFARAITGAAGVAINTDDRNVVEFESGRSVGRRLFPVTEIKEESLTNGSSRPPLEDGDAVRWPELDTAYVSYNAAQGSAEARFVGPPNEQMRQAALVQYYQHENRDAARELWQQQREPPRDPTELAMLADISVSAGAENAAMGYIDRLRGYQPGEAGALLATLRLLQGRLPDAAVILEATLTRLQTDPWPLVRFEERAIQIAKQIADRDPSLAPRMLEALSHPLALDALEDLRLTTRAEITRSSNFGGLCRDAVGALEPHVPWTRTFLTLRHDCYQAAGDPRLVAATRDLDEFTRNEPTSRGNPLASPAGAPATRATRDLTAQELAALTGSAELTYGSQYAGRIYNGNKDVTITQVVAEITTSVNGKRTRQTYTASVNIPPLTTRDVTFGLFVNQGTDYALDLVKAVGY